MATWTDNRRRVLPSRTAYPVPDEAYPRIVAGRGAHLVSETGARYFDASGGSGSLIFGHGDAEIVEALSAQARSLTLFPSRHLGVEVVERYMSELVAFAPAGLDRAITFSSGSDAVEAAIKLAIHYHFALGQPTRTKVIGRRGSYHGNTLSGLSAGGFLARRAPYESALVPVSKAAPANCHACAFGEQPGNCAVECANSVERAILAEGPDTVAAVILEPVVGATLSAIAPDPRYLQRVRAICDRHGVLLIFDEVMSGFGRTGRRFASEKWSVTPDILVCGKAISAGYYPLSAVLASAGIADAFEGPAGFFQNGHTHACSPLGAAVGLLVLERLRQEAILDNVGIMGAALRERLAALCDGRVLARIRGEGLMIGFDLMGADASRSPSTSGVPGAAADRFARAALRRGLIIYASSGGADSQSGAHAMLLPPLNIGPEDVEFVAQTLAAVCRDVVDGRE